MRELREIVQKNGLENKEGADIQGASAPEAQLQRLAELVETVNGIHSRALRMEGAHAANLVSASVERCATQGLRFSMFLHGRLARREPRVGVR